MFDLGVIFSMRGPECLAGIMVVASQIAFDLNSKIFSYEQRFWLSGCYAGKG